MHPAEVENALKTLRVIVDTRERPTAISEKRYEQFGVPYERRKLDFGDYSAVLTLENGEEFSLCDKISVERKLGFQELCVCFTHDRERFKREFERAKEAGAKIYILLENSTWEAAYAGRYRSQMKSQALIASMLAWLARYRCQIIMCKSETSGKLIGDILYREAKEALTGMVEM